LKASDDGHLQYGLKIPQHPLTVKTNSLAACDFIRSKFIQSGDFVGSTLASQSKFPLSYLKPETSNSESDLQ
jgi:hypothetical protein